MELKENSFIKIKDDSEVIITDDKIEIAGSKKKVILKGPDQVVAAQEITPLLKEGTTLREIIRAVSRYEPETIKLFVQQFISYNILDIAFPKNAPSQAKGDFNEILYKKLMDNRSQIIQELIINKNQVGEYQLPFYLASSKYISPKGPLGDKDRWTTGADSDVKNAIVKSIIESIERYSNGKHNLNELTCGSIEKLKDKIVNPYDLVSYKNFQYTNEFPYDPLINSKKYYWKKGYDFFSGKEKLVLADLIYFPFLEKEIKRKRYTGATSSGTAAHISKEKAIEKAVKELIEREAFMIVWLNKTSMPKIKNSSLPATLQQRIKNLKLLSFETHIIDITLDLLPVFLVIITSKKQGLACFVGGGCDSVPEKAVEKALNEAEALFYFGMKYNYKPINKKDIKSPLEHGQYYRDIKNLKFLNFLLKAKKYIPLRKRERKSAKEAVKKEFDSLIVVDLTPEFVKNTFGLSVVKVFVPGMVPISFGYKQESLGMGRISSVPKKLGFKAVKKINIDEPHSFA